MPLLFKLDVETTPEQRRASLVLRDGSDVFLARHDVRLDDHPPAGWEALFNPRDHVRRRQSADEPAADLLGSLGDFLARAVLGPEIIGHLARGERHRTLLLRLPDVTSDPLAAAFARIPWELARAPGSGRTLLDLNLMVSAAAAGAEAGGDAVSVGKDDTVRVLLVFAETKGSNPLAARLERERLLDLFFEEVLPKRDVEVDVLCHGVTRDRIRRHVRARGGYHVVHWSGHGHQDLLGIALDDGEVGEPVLTGRQLVDLLSGDVGFIPEIVFLSACHSGSLADAKDWDALRAALAGGKESSAHHAGAVLELLQCGVKQVVAMRAEVDDTYGRRLARRFYRSLLAEPAHHSADDALLAARKQLLADRGRAKEYDPTDHAMPMIFGTTSVRVSPRERRSAQMDQRPADPLLERGRDLGPPFGFVGRSDELTVLLRRWLEAGGAPIAVIHGLAGLGKTSLAAEAIHLWHTSFDHVLAFQARGSALSLEALYQRIDHRLALLSPAYRQRCDANEMARIYLAPGPRLPGSAREEAMRENLIAALDRERILLVLDNFETNLRDERRPAGEASSDPAWDRLLEALADRLRGSGSRVLVTSRHRLAALAEGGRAVRIGLGPLPPPQALLFFENHRPLRELLQGDAEDQRIARRILDVSRGHPLILARLADLANGYRGRDGAFTQAGRVVLDEALEKLEAKGYKALPGVFAEGVSEAEQDRVRRYLEDVAIGAVDLLLERQTPEARRLLWVVTRAEEAVPEEMLAAAWEEAGTLGELLEALSAAGLLWREGKGWAFHELVAERAAEWMLGHPEQQGARTESEIWTVYGEWCGAAFKTVRASGKSGARDLANALGRRGIRYLVRARAFAKLESFASAVVTGTNDPGLLEQMIADLGTAAAEVPAGEDRWSLRTYLADALNNAGQHDQALPLFEQAVEEAAAAGNWSDVGWICQNWASALRAHGQLERARETYMRSAEAERCAGSPRILILCSEFEALRVDVERGLAHEALPAIEEKLGEVRSLWVRRRQDDNVTEAPDEEDLARTLVGGLDIACQANHELECWQPCLDLLGEIEQVKRFLGQGEHEIARTRFNQYRPLMQLGQHDKAKMELESCLDVFRKVGDIPGESKALSALATVWNTLGDDSQATALERKALALCDRLPIPEDRAISHNNLATHLGRLGSDDEAREHRLADLLYCLIIGLDLRIRLKNLAIVIHNAALDGERFDLPRLTDLLAKPSFATLRTFIDERGQSIPDLQAKVDHLVEQVRAAANSS